jgi:N-acetylglutamate synthase-like GNAT family acetyltransferase
MPHESRRDEFLISTDKSLIDLDAVHDVLARVYWSERIPRDTVKRGIDNSMVFGIYDESGAPRRQVGFARVITDKATFAYLSDVFVIESCRGRGLSKWLMDVILAHPDLQGLRRFCLLTRDAHGLYARYGFKPMPDPTRYLELWDPDIYTRQE